MKKNLESKEDLKIEKIMVESEIPKLSKYLEIINNFWWKFN